ncbi:MAG: DUF1376 domain-containing protein [Hyphomonadaceae bacterium]|nr:DUF1376 domain-containing protein [Hyphomonadaceae bacterium]
MSDTLPPPMTPPNCDCSRLPYMPLLIDQLFKSDLWLETNGEEFKVALKLWGESWRQIPAASLPADDKKLAGLAGVSPAKWKRVRARALHKWVECSDGRLYHAVIAELALTPWIERLENQLKGAKGNATQGKKTAVPPALLQREIDFATECLWRVRNPLQFNAERDALRDAERALGDTQAEAEGELEEEVEEEKEHAMPATASASARAPVAVADADADADARLERLKWNRRLLSIHVEFADVLAPQQSQLNDPIELQVLEAKGYDWDRHIWPGLKRYLEAHRRRMANRTVQPLQSFSHPGIAEQVEECRTNEERLLALRTKGPAHAN